MFSKPARHKQETYEHVYRCKGMLCSSGYASQHAATPPKVTCQIQPLTVGGHAQSRTQLEHMGSTAHHVQASFQRLFQASNVSLHVECKKLCLSAAMQRSSKLRSQAKQAEDCSRQMSACNYAHVAIYVYRNKSTYEA